MTESTVAVAAAVAGPEAIEAGALGAGESVDGAASVSGMVVGPKVRGSIVGVVSVAF